MGLSDDQKALLRLLAQREEGYEDIAALLGLSVGEVRARVKGALAELDSPAGTAAKEATPPPPAAKPAKPPESPAVEPVAEEPAPARAAAARPTARPARPARRPPSVPKDRRRLFELAGGILVVALIALFATGALNVGGDDDGDSAASSADATAAANGKITQAALTPPNGGEAVGRAIFGRVGKGPVLQVVAEGLEPTAEGESYTVWLYRSPRLALRLGSVPVDKSGGLGAQLPLPTELFAFLARGAFDQISISRTNDAEYAAAAAQAKEQKRLPPYSGATVLRGEIVGPLVSQ